MIEKFFKMALLLGLISAIGPFAIDMYLPALPAIGQSLGASTAEVQMSLTVLFHRPRPGQQAMAGRHALG